MTQDWMTCDQRVGVLEARHFFSGAAVYRDGTIVASLTPVGLAFRVPTEIRDALLDSGKAIPLRYFPNSPIKRDYVLFSGSGVEPDDAVSLLIGDLADWAEN